MGSYQRIFLGDYKDILFTIACYIYVIQLGSPNAYFKTNKTLPNCINELSQK